MMVNQQDKDLEADLTEVVELACLLNDSEAGRCIYCDERCDEAAYYHDYCRQAYLAEEQERMQWCEALDAAPGLEMEA